MREREREREKKKNRQKYLITLILFIGNNSAEKAAADRKQATDCG